MIHKQLKEIVPEYYSNNPLIRKLFLKRIEKSIELAEIKDNENLLDAGCGDGVLLKNLPKDKKLRCYGIDYNPFVKNLHIKKCKILVSDIRKLPFVKNFFDKIFCLDILEHIIDIKKALFEIKRVLKKDGLLIVSGPTESLFYKIGRFLTKGTFSEREGPCSPHYYNIFDIESILTKNGFKLIKTLNLPSFPIPPLFKILVFIKNE
jgi:ubiquinone/menaquinone biosynthesis C-methylase UbiE